MIGYHALVDSSSVGSASKRHKDGKLITCVFFVSYLMEGTSLSSNNFVRWEWRNISRYPEVRNSTFDEAISGTPLYPASWRACFSISSQTLKCILLRVEFEPGKYDITQLIRLWLWLPTFQCSSPLNFLTIWMSWLNLSLILHCLSKIEHEKWKKKPWK